MDQSKPRGDFVAFMNRDKQPGDSRPAFEGRIAKPGTEEYSTCNRHAPAGQRAQMEKYRAWFHETRRPTR